jgi:hypothetical protein
MPLTRLIKSLSIIHLNVLLSQYIPSNIFNKNSLNIFARRRIFSPENIFWGALKYLIKMVVVNQLRAQSIKKLRLTIPINVRLLPS